MTKSHSQKLDILTQKTDKITNGNSLLIPPKLIPRGMNVDECKILLTSPLVNLREKVYYRIVYQCQFRPFEALNLLIENWDREQRLITAVMVKRKTKPLKGSGKHKKEWLKPEPREGILSEITNEMLRKLIGNRKKGYIFVNRNGEKLSKTWFKQKINEHAKLLNIQKTITAVTVNRKGREINQIWHLITVMALREAGERHHDNAGGNPKLSAIASGHTMDVKNKYYGKPDFEEVHKSTEKYNPAFVEGW